MNASATGTSGSAEADNEFDYLTAEFEVTGTTPIAVSCSITPTNVESLSLAVGGISIDKSNPSASGTIQPGLHELNVRASDLGVDATGLPGAEPKNASKSWSAQCHTTG